MTKKQKILNFLNRNKEIIIKLDKGDILLLVIHEVGCSYGLAEKYYYEWKADNLGISLKTVNKNRRRPVGFNFIKFNGNLTGNNGTYRKNGKGMLLTNGKAYINFESRDHMLKFIDELILAFNKLESEEDE